MALEFNGFEIPGLFGRVYIGGRAHQSQRTKFWGLDGESEISGGWGARPIVINHTFFGDYQSYNDITAALDDLDRRTGANGRLSLLNSAMNWEFYDVTFDGAEKLFAPMRDVAGTLDGGYWTELILYFTQLSDVSD